VSINYFSEVERETDTEPRWLCLASQILLN